MKKPIMVAVMLTMVLAATIPALAQQGEDCVLPGLDCPVDCVGEVGCGTYPPSRYPPAPENPYAHCSLYGGISECAPLSGPDAWPDEASFLQYETARCMDPLADHSGCVTFINPDGSLSQA